MGVGASISTAVSERTAVVIEDYMFDASTVGELKPEESPSDFHDTWDLDGTDFTPEVSPDDEGYWDDFENVVLNGNYEELGSELVDFPNASITLETGWSFTNGILTQDGSGAGQGASADANISNTSFDLNKQYKFTITVSSYTSGDLHLLLSPNTNVPFNINGTGEFTVYGGFYIDNNLHLRAGYGDFVGSISNLSIKQVDPNDRWTLATGWSIEDGKAVAVAPNTSGFSITQSNVLTAGVPHELTFTVSERTAGSVRFRADFVNGTQRSADGTYTEIITPAGTTLSLQGLNSFVGKIDNVTVKEYAIKPLDV